MWLCRRRPGPGAWLLHAVMRSNDDVMMLVVQDGVDYDGSGACRRRNGNPTFAV